MEIVNQYPLSLLFTAFGLGVGVGIVAVHCLSEPEQETYARMSQRVGRQVLDSLSTMLPEPISHVLSR
jgi:hypothetical protein